MKKFLLILSLAAGFSIAASASFTTTTKAKMAFCGDEKPKSCCKKGDKSAKDCGKEDKDAACCKKGDKSAKGSCCKDKAKKDASATPAPTTKPAN